MAAKMMIVIARLSKLSCASRFSGSRFGGIPRSLKLILYLERMTIYDNVVLLAKYPIQVFDTVTGKRLHAFNRDKYEPNAMPAGLLDSVTDRHDTAFWYYDDWAGNFGHFSMDQSHNVLKFEAMAKKPELFVNDVDFVHELLALRGIRGTTLAMDGKVHFFKRIMLPTPICWHGCSPLPSPVLRFFNEIRDCVPDCTPPIERLMITRRDSPGRRPLANETELVEKLKHLGFVAYEFGPLSLSERISLVRRARFLFTHSGAGACNHLWIRPGTMTITLYNPHLHGEEVNNSHLTRSMGGTPYVMDEHGKSFANERNFGEYNVPWELPSVDAVVSTVRARLVTAYPRTHPN